MCGTKKEIFKMAAEPAGTLLTVEDEPEIRKLTVLHAEALGLKVLEADDGQHALEILKTSAPDVIISDMKMPRKDGMTLLKELRESGNQTPFLFLSAFTGKEYTVRALSLGAFDYLEKPYLPNELKALIHEMLRVGRAQKGILAKTLGSSGHQTGTISPEAEILRMSSLRSEPEGLPASGASSSINADRHTRLVRMFAAEVQNQLTHGLKALTDLKHSESPGWQLGYLFRLMYSVRSTAASLKLEAIRDLSLAMEQTYVLLRVRTSYLNKLTLATLQVAHDLLRQHIESIDGENPISPDQKNALQTETHNTIQDLRAIAIAK
jgi:DNA-binding response OmpR family regulator